MVDFTLDNTSCINNCMDALIERLDLKLLVQNADSAKAGLVREGRLQADPNVAKINVLVQQGGEEWPDILDTKAGEGGKSLDSAYETGGGDVQSASWRRRFQVEWQMFLGNAVRDDGRRTANLVVSRAMNALYTWNLGIAAEYDSFGEHAYDIEITKTYLDAGGGPGAWNWRGMMYVEFLTQIEPDNETH